MWYPIQSVSEDLNDGRDVADDAFIGTLFQSLIRDGKECRRKQRHRPEADGVSSQSCFYNRRLLRLHSLLRSHAQQVRKELNLTNVYSTASHVNHRLAADIQFVAQSYNRVLSRWIQELSFRTGDVRAGM
ncbi:hypothetical protein LSAT2_004108 [Lamellibrachia satsuma]|nr:hypothetical protein LSAT2_004108 [Lamellibrachia satsuma]